MASPPFVISTVIPGDSDIVSQFPLVDRTVRDVIQSWILANHDTNGNHVTATMPYQSSTPATPAASLLKVYADVNGRLKIVYPDGTLGFVGIPPGTIIHGTSSTTPVGYLVADGSAVSRTTYADFFAQISTTYGAGNGSTTFNLPDIQGRVIAGEDGGQIRLSAPGLSTGASLAAVGGAQTRVLTQSQLPNVNWTVTDPGHSHTGTIPFTISGTAAAAAGSGGTVINAA